MKSRARCERKNRAPNEGLDWRTSTKACSDEYRMRIKIHAVRSGSEGQPELGARECKGGALTGDLDIENVVAVSVEVDGED